MKAPFFFVLILLLPGFVMLGQAQTIDDDIRHLMAVNGSDAAAKAGIKGMIGMMKTNSSASPLPAEFWDELEAEFTGPALDELMAGYVPIYKAHFSPTEIKQLTAFYESPVGKKIVAETPGITQESMKMGSEWGRALGEKVARRVAEKQKKL